LTKFIGVAIAVLAFYILPAILSWIATRAFMAQHKKTPTLSDVFCVFCPVLNIYVALYYVSYIESGIDASGFFRLKKVKK
jgi:hypothetical protein